MSTVGAHSLKSVLAGLAALLLTATVAGAQMQGVPNAAQGFAKNRNEPIRIESQSLEVRDRERTATFIDNVKLTQGDTTLESRRLTVYYEEPDRGGATGATAARRVSNTAGTQHIRRLEASGGVVVTQREQTAVGDQGVYDMRANSMTLIGNVVVTQGKNVIRGDRLVVDLVTGTSRIESKAGQGRVQGVFLPGGAAKPEPPPSAAPPAGRSGAPNPPSRPSPPPARSSDRDRPRTPPGPPVRLN